MVECVAFIFAGASTQSWTPDQDVSLIGFAKSGLTMVVSMNPSLTATALVGQQQVVDHLIAAGTSASTAPLSYTPLSYQVGKGQTVYVSADGSGGLYLYYAPDFS